MARRDTATDTTDQRLADSKGHSVGPAIEEAPGINLAAETTSPMGSPVLYEGVDGESIEGVDGESIEGVDGEARGSTLFDDLAGSDLPDPTDGFDDQNSWAMDLPSGLPGHPAAAPAATPTDGELLEGLDTPTDSELLEGAGEVADGYSALAEEEAEAEAEPEEEPPSGDDGDDGDDEREGQGGYSGDDDDEDETESQGGSSQHGSSDGPRESQSMPAPDDGTGGDPSTDDFIGGPGDVDPPPETEDQGGGGGLDTERAGFGAVDPAPESEDSGGAGGLDMQAVGRGAVDPLDGESTLLGGDTGDLAELAAETDLSEAEVEFDDFGADDDIGEDV